MTYHSAMGQGLAEGRRHMFAPRFAARQSFNQRFAGVGQLTMDPQTQAALQACSDNCEKQYGVASGMPNVIALTSCFLNCDLQYPPTVTVPGGGTAPGVPPVLPPPAEEPPPIVPGVIDEPKPVTPTGPAKASAAGDMKMWVIGGAVVLAAVGVYAYTRKK